MTDTAINAGIKTGMSEGMSEGMGPALASPDGGARAGHGAMLTALSHGCADRVKGFAESLLPSLGAIDVLRSRTGLVMLPFRDTVKGTDFHLGEVLVAEAEVRLTAHGSTGYGMVTGRDLEWAMAMALIDAAAAAGIEPAAINAFVAGTIAANAARDRQSLCAIEATRVDMETF